MAPGGGASQPCGLPMRPVDSLMALVIWDDGMDCFSKSILVLKWSSAANSGLIRIRQGRCRLGRSLNDRRPLSLVLHSPSLLCLNLSQRPLSPATRLRPPPRALHAARHPSAATHFPPLVLTCAVALSALFSFGPVDFGCRCISIGVALAHFHKSMEVV